MDATPRFGLLVIGSGAAGVHAATTYVGVGGAGPVCLVSADNDPPYQRPPLSKAVLAGRQPATVTPILDDGSALDAVELRLGTRVTVLDAEGHLVHTDDGRRLAFDRLVVATGSSARTLPNVDPEAHVFTLRSLENARRLVDDVQAASSVVVVGSGFIGCEAAASLASRGLRTTLVTPESRPQAARLGPWAADRIAQWLRSGGVELRTKVQVTAVNPPARIRVEDGATLEAGLVLAAVGVTQNQRFLDASGLGLEHGRVVVDERLQARDAPIWAAGDVASARHGVAGPSLGVEHWGDAIAMGQVAGHNAARHGAAGSPEPHSWTDPPGFWTEIGDHTLKYAAWGDGYEDETVVEHPGDAFTVWYADSGGELVGVLTHERDQDYERGGRLLARRATLAEALSSAGSPQDP